MRGGISFSCGDDGDFARCSGETDEEFGEDSDRIGVCWCVFFFIDQNCSVPRCGRQDESAFWRVQSPTGNFCTDKSYQKPLRGHPLKTPFLRGRTTNAQFCFRHDGNEWANHLPRSPAPAAVKSVAAFALECLVLQVLQASPPSRHTGGKLQFFVALLFSGSGAHSA